MLEYDQLGHNVWRLIIEHLTKPAERLALRATCKYFAMISPYSFVPFGHVEPIYVPLLRPFSLSMSGSNYRAELYSSPLRSIEYIEYYGKIIHIKVLKSNDRNITLVSGTRNAIDWLEHMFHKPIMHECRPVLFNNKEKFFLRKCITNKEFMRAAYEGRHYCPIWGATMMYKK